MKFIARKKCNIQGNEITKILLCLMIKSICRKYRAVISMIPITIINATILYTIWESNIKVLTEIGFNVGATITDGHESNVKFFARLTGIHLQPYYVNNPYSSGKKIFLLFDPVHLFTNFYNNCMNYSTFRYLIYEAEYFGHDILEAKFAHIKELYHIEVGKSIKLARKHNDKVINPCV